MPERPYDPKDPNRGYVDVGRDHGKGVTPLDYVEAMALALDKGDKEHACDVIDGFIFGAWGYVLGEDQKNPQLHDLRRDIRGMIITAYRYGKGLVNRETVEEDQNV